VRRKKKRLGRGKMGKRAALKKTENATGNAEKKTEEWKGGKKKQFFLFKEKGGG